MPRKQLNAYQLELRSIENKAHVKKITETNQRIFRLAEQKDLERKRLCRLALEQKLARNHKKTLRKKLSSSLNEE